MTLDNDDKQWVEKAIVKGVIEGINQVMIPYSEDQENRFNAKFKNIDKKFKNIDKKFKNIDEKIEDLRSDLSGQISNLERKLDNVTDHQAEVLDDHEKRIGKLEVASI